MCCFVVFAVVVVVAAAVVAVVPAPQGLVLAKGTPNPVTDNVTLDVKTSTKLTMPISDTIKNC